MSLPELPSPPMRQRAWERMPLVGIEQAWDRETARPVMRALLATLWVLIAAVLLALAYFHFTAASEPTARHPATTAHEAGVVVTGGTSK